MPDSPLDRLPDSLTELSPESPTDAAAGGPTDAAAVSLAGSPTPAPADDRAEIGRLADDLLPALMAKLSASGLGELEVRQAAWRIRLRMPAVRPGTDTPAAERRVSGHVRSQSGHAGHPHPTSGGELHRGLDGRGASSGGADGRGAALTAVGPGRPAHGSGHRDAAAAGEGDGHRHRAVATSPAVGFFEPRRDVSSGRRVHEGDRLGTVDVLGIKQDVLAPEDGIVGASLVESGEAVEYGQDLLWIELTAEHAAESAAVSVAASGKGGAFDASGMPASGSAPDGTGVAAPVAAPEGARGPDGTGASARTGEAR